MGCLEGAGLGWPGHVLLAHGTSGTMRCLSKALGAATNNEGWPATPRGRPGGSGWPASVSIIGSLLC